MEPGRHQAGEVGHVDEQVSAHSVRDRAETLEIEYARVSRPARHDQPRPVLAGRLDLVHVDQARLAVDVIGDDVVRRSGDDHRRSVHGGHRAPRPRSGSCPQDRAARGSTAAFAWVPKAGERRSLGAEQGACAVDRQPLGSFVIGSAARYVGLACADLERPPLMVRFPAEELRDLGIDVRQWTVREV